MQTVKHFFDRYVVIQYSILNTLEDHILSEVKLKVVGVESAYNLKLAKAINLEPSDKIKVNEKRYVYAVLTKEACDHPFPQAKLTQKLQLKITEIEVDS